jgi:hypothetical protein
VAWTGAIFVTGLIMGEVIARFGFGLADPPLYMADAEIEYLSRPNQDCHYLGNRIQYNQFSMRSDPMPLEKGPDEIRIMVIGDSVVAGGVKIDQSQLATELLKRNLGEATRRPVLIGNIAAAGWGPPNQLAYVQQHGLFDADCVVIVLSSGDYGDAPTFEPKVGVDPSFPERKPVSALFSLIERGLSSRMRNETRRERQSQEEESDPDDVAVALGALRELITRARDTGAPVLAAMHLQRREAEGDLQPGHAMIRSVLDELDVPIVEVGPAFIDSIRAGVNPYLDWIHPNPVGHRLIAEQLSMPILDAMGISDRND